MLLTCEDDEVLIEGRAGTGKSIGACYKLLRCAAKYPGSHLLICRQTRKSMTDTILVTLESLIGEDHPEVTRCSREQRHSYRLWGSEIVCGGLDEPSKIYSSGWDLVYLNEGIESTLDAWELFARGTRDPKYRRHGTTRAMPYQQRMMDLNPGPPGHWANHRAYPCPNTLRRVESWDDWQRLDDYNSGPQPGKMRRLVSVHQDNPTWFDVDSWTWTPEGQKQINSLRTMSGHRRTRMLEGQWCAAEGQVFPDFSEDRHTVDDFPVPADWPAFLACDPGYDHPTAILIGVMAPNERMYLVGEYVRRETTIEQDAAWITQWERTHPCIIRRKLGDPHYIDHRTKHNSGVTIVDHMRRYGHSFELAPAAANGNDLNTQVGWVRDWLTTRLGDGHPKLQVFKGCQMTINAFQSWSFKRNSKGEMTGAVDQYEEAYKDEMDAVRMLVASNPRYARQQWSVTR